VSAEIHGGLALAELERLRGAVGAQRERVSELERAARESGRRVALAREALADFYARRERARARATNWDVATGEPCPEPGEPSEAELIDALREAEGGLTVKPEVHTLETHLVVVDPKAEAMLGEARAILQEREAELREWVRGHLADLAAGRAPRARLVAAECEGALRAATAAMGAYESERTWWASVLSLTVGEGDPPLIDTPGNPFAGLQQGVRVVPPLPGRFMQ
jgi:capsule polysaccharide export protein KpsE/RkpR